MNEFLIFRLCKHVQNKVNSKINLPLQNGRRVRTFYSKFTAEISIYSLGVHLQVFDRIDNR